MALYSSRKCTSLGGYRVVSYPLSFRVSKEEVRIQALSGSLSYSFTRMYQKVILYLPMDMMLVSKIYQYVCSTPVYFGFFPGRTLLATSAAGTTTFGGVTYLTIARNITGLLAPGSAG